MKKPDEVYIRGFDNMPKIAQSTLLEMARIVCQAVIEGQFEGAGEAPSVSKRTVRLRRKPKQKR